MVLSATMCMSIMLYHEARGVAIPEQMQVAQVAQNRATAQNKPLCAVVLDGKQFSWANGYKKQLKFKTASAALKHYNVTDGNAFITAVGIASMSGVSTSKDYFYHDNTIKGFSKPMMQKITVTNKTKNFTFYKEKLS